MKLIKTFNPLRNILRHASNWNRYRLLSLVITALLFFGTNSQIMAAAMPISVSAPSSSITSEDQFNATSFLKASSPDADNQQWTTTEKIGNFVVGLAGLAALSYGGYRAYKYFRPGEVDASGKEREGLRNRTREEIQDENRLITSNGSSPNTSPNLNRDITMGRAREKGKGSDNRVENGVESVDADHQSVLTGLQRGLAVWGMKAWDNIATLKDCWPASDKFPVPAESFKKQFTIALQKLPKNTNAGAGQQSVWLEYENPEDSPLEEKIQELNPKKEIEDMMSLLDERNKELANKAIKKYAALFTEKDSAKKLAYFFAKKQDELELKPEYLNGLIDALDKVMTSNKTKEFGETNESGETKESDESVVVDEEDQTLVNTLHDAVEALWEEDAGRFWSSVSSDNLRGEVSL